MCKQDMHVEISFQLLGHLGLNHNSPRIQLRSEEFNMLMKRVLPPKIIFLRHPFATWHVEFSRKSPLDSWEVGVDWSRNADDDDGWRRVLDRVIYPTSRPIQVTRDFTVRLSSRSSTLFNFLWRPKDHRHLLPSGFFRLFDRVRQFDRVFITNTPPVTSATIFLK